MRNTAMSFLTKQAEQDPNLYLLVGDVGFSVIEEFKEKFPKRYINTGVGEQNMIGMAAGLAMAGKNVYVYSIIPFVTMRCFEQIRVDLCYQNLPVKIIGVGAGFSYGPMGATHHAIEDIGILRCLPGMTIVAPGNKKETQELMADFNDLKGPGYLRLSKTNIDVIYLPNTSFKVGKALEIIPNKQHFIIASGNALKLAVEVYRQLSSQGISIGLISIPTVKPLDEEFFIARKNYLQSIFVIEEHNVIGGLGDALAKFLLEKFEQKVTFKNFGINDFYYHEAGSQNSLCEKTGLTVPMISSEITKRLKKEKSIQV